MTEDHWLDLLLVKWLPDCSKLKLWCKPQFLDESGMATPI